MTGPAPTPYETPSRLARWLARPSRTRVTAANIGVVLTAAALTALGGLVAEDLLPKPAPDTMFVVSRLIATAVTLVLLITLVYLRGRMHSVTGTLFYLSVLDEAWVDLRQTAAHQAGAKHMAFRSVSRWMDLHHRTDEQGVIEVNDVAREVGTALEELVNNDTPDTGFTVAPNMPWPLALSVGAYLPGLRGMRIAQMYPYDPADSFPLDAAQRAVAEHREHGTNAEPRGRIGVWLAFTNAAARFSQDRLGEFGVTEVHVVSPVGGPPTPNKPARKLNSEELALLSAELAEYLVAFKQQADKHQRELVVVAMIPSSVAFAVGWQLAQRECRFFADTHLMHFDQDRGYLPMRVRESQPHHPPRPMIGAADA
jgi:hypothetical protein